MEQVFERACVEIWHRGHLETSVVPERMRKLEHNAWEHHGSLTASRLHMPWLVVARLLHKRRPLESLHAIIIIIVVIIIIIIYYYPLLG